MHTIVVRPAKKFREPAFSRLQQRVFADVTQYSPQWEAVLAEEAATLPLARHKHGPLFRLGAYAGTELVGWSCGWMERGNVFYVANSGVVAAYRRQGVYTALLAAMQAHAQAAGAVLVRSQHSVVNNPVIIAKLRFGFTITGLSQSAQLGTLVELSCHLSQSRQALHGDRVLPYLARNPR